MEASLGTYRVVRKLGQGGMAEVFLVRRNVPGASPWAQNQELALKRIRPELADNPEYSEMLLEEARLGAALALEVPRHVEPPTEVTTASLRLCAPAKRLKHVEPGP